MREKEMRKEENSQNNKNKLGITLIALVVTIIVLLILAGITINMLFSNGGIFKTAQDAANAWNEATINEQESLSNIAEQIGNLVNGQVGGESETPEETDEIIDIATVTKIVEKEEGQKAKDSYGNVVVVPKGFKVVISEGITVPEGIVIEDVNGNQFVWIPVGTVHKDNNTENDVIIQLGRYTFNTTNGIPTDIQLAYTDDNLKNYMNQVSIKGINDQHIEEYESRDGIATSGINGLNATAKDLVGFVDSVRNNGGYYLARYEASYGSGSSTADWKPLSKISIGTPRQDSKLPLLNGMLWNYISQIDASKISKNMYANDNAVNVDSDLVNSYAWDTAIVFIQKMDETKTNYANKTDGNGTLKNTGTTGDKACNVFDMASNLIEWTTEYSPCIVNSNFARAATSRGGYYNTFSRYTAQREDNMVNSDSIHFTFRVILYIRNDNL